MRYQLSPDQQLLVSDLRAALADMRSLLRQLSAHHQEEDALLAEAARRLDGLFLLVVVGEFNAGKSAFLNALLGSNTLDEGVTPTTSSIHLLTHGAAAERRRIDAGLEEWRLPVALLENIQIVDTPGTNAIDRRHEALTDDFVPRSDLVLFVTSVDRPFSESERGFLQRLRDWGKKTVFVLNKVDLLRTPEELAEVESFVRGNVERLWGFEPQIFAVSARRALEAKLAGDEAALAASGFPELEAYVETVLDDDERLRLKLLNPIGVADRIAAEVRGALEERQRLLADDFDSLARLEKQRDLYREDMQREFGYRRAEIEKLLDQVENRGHDFFDDTLRLARIPDLLNKARIQSQFEQRVIGDLPQDIERRVSDLIDWMVAAELRQWQSVVAHASERKAHHAEHMVGEMTGPFESGRQQLLDSLGRSASRAVSSYDQRREANRLADAVRMSVTSTALLEVGAVGLGTLVAAIASTTAADITGLLAAGALATVGLFVIPARRRQAKKALHDRLEQMRGDLSRGLSEEFETEIERSIRRVEEAIAPYVRFVRAERERIDAGHEELGEIRGRLGRLRAAVEG